MLDGRVLVLLTRDISWVRRAVRVVAVTKLFGWWRLSVFVALMLVATVVRLMELYDDLLLMFYVSSEERVHVLLILVVDDRRVIP